LTSDNSDGEVLLCRIMFITRFLISASSGISPYCIQRQFVFRMNDESIYLTFSSSKCIDDSGVSCRKRQRAQSMPSCITREFPLLMIIRLEHTPSTSRCSGRGQSDPGHG
jgi:hypothetical protein